MPRPTDPSNVAASSAATSAWANEVVDAINAVLNDIYGATDLELPWASITDAFSATAPTALAIGDTAAIGVATQPARNDHRHAMPAFGNVTAQTSFGASSANGAATSVSHSDHTHGTPAAQTAASLNVPTTYNTPATATTRRVYVGSATPTGASEGDAWIQG